MLIFLDESVFHLMLTLFLPYLLSAGGVLATPTPITNVDTSGTVNLAARDLKTGFCSVPLPGNQGSQVHVCFCNTETGHCNIVPYAPRPPQNPGSPQAVVEGEAA